jgi:hypothetical protein
LIKLTLCNYSYSSSPCFLQLFHPLPSSGVWTQGFTLGMQVLYHLSHLQPFLLWLFWSQGFTFYRETHGPQSLDFRLPTVAGLIVVCHHTQFFFPLWWNLFDLGCPGTRTFLISASPAARITEACFFNVIFSGFYCLISVNKSATCIEINWLHQGTIGGDLSTYFLLRKYHHGTLDLKCSLAFGSTVCYIQTLPKVYHLQLYFFQRKSKQGLRYNVLLT